MKRAATQERGGGPELAFSSVSDSEERNAATTTVRNEERKEEVGIKSVAARA